MQNSNVLPNLDKLEKLLKKEPKATHVYFRTDDERYVDVPVAQAVFTIRNKPKWTVEDLGTSEVAHTPVQNPWPTAKVSEIGKAKEAEQAAAAAAPVELPPKPSEEEKKEDAPASTDGQADAPVDQNTANADTSTDTAPVNQNTANADTSTDTAPVNQNTANADTSTDTAPVKSQYRALKNFEHPEGVQHKYRDVLELTDEEAAAFPAECLKKIDA